MSLSRRDFARATAMTALSYARVLGANDRLRLGLIGAGERGVYVMGFFQKHGDVDVVGVADVWGDRVEQERAKAPAARAYADHRALVEQKDLDAVLIATPDHWHAGVAIDALNAGKDVYCEKPLVRRREDGRAIVRAARVNNRVCQVGMQQRSGKIYLEAKQRFVDSGLLGKVRHATCIWNSAPPDALPTAPAQKPANLDWTRYVAPVSYRDWNPAMFLEFRAFLDFGGGKMTDFGAHWIDVVHMFTGVDTPLSVSSHCGIFYDRHDGRTAPDMVSALYTYPGFTVQFESLALMGGGPEYGVTLHGERGRLFVTRHRYEFWPMQEEGKSAPPSIKQQIPGDITQDHVHNFVECVKSRRRPNGDVEHGHRSAQACLLAVQAHEESRTIRFDAEREEILPH